MIDISLSPQYQRAIQMRMFKDRYAANPDYSDIDAGMYGQAAARDVNANAIANELRLNRMNMASSGGFADLQQRYLNLDRDREYARNRNMFETAKKQNRIATGLNIANLGVGMLSSYDIMRQQKQREAEMGRLSDQYRGFADWFVQRMKPDQGVR